MNEPAGKRRKFDTANGRRLIVILERAQLETAKLGKSYELLNSDKHASFLKKQKKDPAEYRPDILHQCLLMLMDSPLNRSGMLQVFIHTERNVLIEVNPQTRIPRTFERFAGLMVQLLHKLQIRAADGPQKLLKVVKNPVTSHLPLGCPVLGTSFHADEFIHPRDLVPKGAKSESPIAIVIGSMARGKVTVDYTERELKLSSFPLSAALTCAKICGAFEDEWGIR